MAAGQAELDLPDPLEQSAPASGSGGPTSAPTEDDLLAQLAGDEIDRLLAEAGVPAPKPAGSATVPEALAPDPADVPIAPDDVERELSAQLDSLFKEIEKPAETKADATSIEALPASSGEPAVVVENPVGFTAVTPELVPTPPTSLVYPAPAQVTSVAPVELKFDNLPPPRRSWLWNVVLTPLELLSLPLSGTSDATRATVGKLAILTLFNAIAVIVYVLVFRGR